MNTEPDTSIYGAPVTTEIPRIDPVPAVAPSVAAKAAGMSDLRAQIQTKDAQDWEPRPWEPLDPKSSYPGAESAAEMGV